MCEIERNTENITTDSSVPKTFVTIAGVLGACGTLELENRKITK